MIRFLCWTLLVCALALPASAPCAAQRAAAEGDKTVAVISIASYERLLADLAYLSKLTGNPDLDKQVEGALSLLTQDQGLLGFDKTRPLGMVLSTDGVQFQPLILLPVTDMSQLLDVFSTVLGDPVDLGGGVLEVALFDQSIYFKEQAGYACVAMSADALATLPEKPGALLEDLGGSLDLAARLHVQNIPDPYRSMLVDQLRLGIRDSVERKPNESDAELAGRRKAIESQVDSIVKVVSQVEQFTIGAMLDPAAGRGYLDLQVKAIEGTSLAKLFGQIDSRTSDFAGFIQNDLAGSLNLTAKISPEQTPQLVSAFRSLRNRILREMDSDHRLSDPNTRRVFQEVFNQFSSALTDTLHTGRIDAGAAVSLGEGSLALVGGAHIKDPLALEDALRKFARLGELSPDFPQVVFDAMVHDGVRFHTTSIAVPQDQPIAKVLGERLDVAVGIGEDRVYLAIGRGSLDLCKSLMDKSRAQAGQLVPPLRVRAALKPIFDFAAVAQPTPGGTAATQAIAEISRRLASRKSHDNASMLLIPHGTTLTVRVEAEESVLQLIASALAQAAASVRAMPPAP